MLALAQPRDAACRCLPLYVWVWVNPQQGANEEIV
jgi:hypothetical protein